MAHASYLREKARSLRVERKLTIDELADRLALSRSTIYYWVRDLPIPGSGPGGQFPWSARRKGNRAMQWKYRTLREQAYRKGWESFEELCADPSFRDFVCLYIAEGYKRSRNTVAICNSDPAVMQLATRWVRHLTLKPPRFALQYHRDQRLDELRQFWAGAVDTEPHAIRVQRKSNSNQLKGRRFRSRYGVLTVSVHDTLLRAQLQAWVDRLQRNWLDSVGHGA
jgi:excisionase family DNA binding protein